MIQIVETIFDVAAVLLAVFAIAGFCIALKEDRDGPSTNGCARKQKDYDRFYGRTK